VTGGELMDVGGNEREISAPPPRRGLVGVLVLLAGVIHLALLLNSLKFVEHRTTFAEPAARGS
jgi:hypothetical protein